MSSGGSNENVRQRNASIAVSENGTRRARHSQSSLAGSSAAASCTSARATAAAPKVAASSRATTTARRETERVTDAASRVGLSQRDGSSAYSATTEIERTWG